MKKLLICGIVILSLLGLMVGTAQGWWGGRYRYGRDYWGGRGYWSRPRVVVGAPPVIVSDQYPAPVYPAPGYYGYPYPKTGIGFSLGGRRGGISIGF